MPRPRSGCGLARTAGADQELSLSCLLGKATPPCRFPSADGLPSGLLSSPSSITGKPGSSHPSKACRIDSSARPTTWTLRPARVNHCPVPIAATSRHVTPKHDYVLSTLIERCPLARAVRRSFIACEISRHIWQPRQHNSTGSNSCNVFGNIYVPFHRLRWRSTRLAIAKKNSHRALPVDEGV